LEFRYVSVYLNNSAAFFKIHLFLEKKLMNLPAELKYAKDHEWIRIESDKDADGKTVAVVGITEFAQNELGDIVYVEIETVGESIEQGAVFGTVEAVKTVSDLFMPVTGKVVEKNELLENSPESINSDPYQEGWMIKIAVEDESELDSLLSAEGYQEVIA
jgi:glycine cleavage system H protein